jgi:hypothetical protein
VLGFLLEADLAAAELLLGFLLALDVIFFIFIVYDANDNSTIKYNNIDLKSIYL